MAANASIVSFLAADDATVDAMMDRAMPPDNGTASSRQRESNYLLYIGVTVTNFPENQLTTTGYNITITRYTDPRTHSLNTETRGKV